MVAIVVKLLCITRRGVVGHVFLHDRKEKKYILSRFMYEISRNFLLRNSKRPVSAKEKKSFEF